MRSLHKLKLRFGVDNHGAEFKHREGASTNTHSTLFEEDGTTIIDRDRECYQGQHGRQEQDQHQGEAAVHERFCNDMDTHGTGALDVQQGQMLRGTYGQPRSGDVQEPRRDDQFHAAVLQCPGKAAQGRTGEIRMRGYSDDFGINQIDSVDSSNGEPEDGHSHDPQCRVAAAQVGGTCRNGQQPLSRLSDKGVDERFDRVRATDNNGALHETAIPTGPVQPSMKADAHHQGSQGYHEHRDSQIDPRKSQIGQVRDNGHRRQNAGRSPGETSELMGT